MNSSISGYSFTPSDLAVGRRLPGVSAFMRIRNGADFLEATIRSHVAFFDEIVAVYNASTDGTGDILARLAAQSAPADLSPYDEEAMSREVGLFTEYYCPAVGIDADKEPFLSAWRGVWGDVLAIVADNPVLVLRDYHADNLMVLPEREDLGLLDFQDALAGHAAYDLVSLLQDARRDVAPSLEQAMIERYSRAANVADPVRFRAHYEILGAQRNTKILGIFTRLWKRDGKPHYLPLQPRVWNYLERNLAHPALAPVRAWFDEYLPVEKRAAAWTRDAAA